MEPASPKAKGLVRRRSASHIPTMDLFRAAEKLMTMDDDAWDRHANPWSVYSRMSILPLLTIAIWSRAWLGWWALVPVAMVAAWTWVNPRAFAVPKTFDTWAGKGTKGERAFLARQDTPIPQHHVRWALGLTWVSAVGVPFYAYGLWAFDVFATIAGLVLIIGGKLWFVDRMVWLYEDMARAAR
ncbi:MAG: DUF6653 family protein [Pseudomonadota bacterium]